MSEFYVELQDSDGTAYGTTDPWTDETLYFDDLEEARLFAKGQLYDNVVLARVVDEVSGRVVDFFQR